MSIRYVILIIVLFCTACGGQAAPTSTPTATITMTATATETSTVTLTSTLTPTPTDIPTETASPTLTNTPTLTVTPSITPTQTQTPFPTPLLLFDNFELIELPDNIRDGIDTPLIAYVNQNNSSTIRNLSTAQPPTNSETLYFGSPINPIDRIPILELTASTNNQIFVAPQGNAVAYFVESNFADLRGLYVLDIRVGLSGRIMQVDSLIQRGIFSAPAWSPDGTTLAISVDSGYDLDIYTFDVANSLSQPLITDPSFEFWQTWSPDGRYLAFVSDRAACASWRPGAAGVCNPDTNPFPTGGQLYILEISTGEITQLSDQILSEPPQWINSREIAFNTGNRFDLLNPSRSLWIATVADQQAREVRLSDGDSVEYNISENWSADGTKVIFQSVGENLTEIVVMDANGNRLATLDDLSFGRFTMSAAWSPDGTRLAIGGSGGQCPYGIRVLDEEFDYVARGNQPRSMCEPVFSPDGQFIAFTGVNPTVGDGRVDVYTSTANGFGAVNLTANLRGQMILLGWVSPQ